MREAVARFVDDSDFLDFKADYGMATVCGHAAVQGHRLGIVTNNGPLDPAGASKATHFIQACCQAGLPILYLQNTTGYIVGKASEEAGMIKRGAKMIQAVSNANVPQVTLMCGASFGAGNYGMCGRAYNPRFLFSWPNAQTAVMGTEQAALTMAIVMEGGMKRKGLAVDAELINKTKDQIVENLEKQQSAFVTSASMLDDGIIEPATRATRSATRCPSARMVTRAPCGPFNSALPGPERATGIDDPFTYSNAGQEVELKKLQRPVAARIIRTLGPPPIGHKSANYDNAADWTPFSIGIVSEGWRQDF